VLQIQLEATHFGQSYNSLSFNRFAQRLGLPVSLWGVNSVLLRQTVWLSGGVVEKGSSLDYCPGAPVTLFCNFPYYSARTE